ncbi:MAG TPA: hypothetical protein VHW65_12595 [Gemmatimonadales bacterium]|jgi:hypothetical protein|nr:hypothetical protein [Gemmatimonadales bacterium]
MAMNRAGRAPAWIGGLAVLAVMPFAAGAQQPPVITLKPANGKRDLAGVSSVRELADGRVIVTNGRVNRIDLLDLAQGAMTQIGQVPGHPKDFVTAGLIFPFYHDSSLMMILGPSDLSCTWVMFDGITVLGVVPNESPLITAVTRLHGGTDTAGHILATQVSHHTPGEPLQGTDSVYLVLVDHGTAVPDTVAHLAQYSGPGRVFHHGDSLDAFSPPMESAAVAPDGWIAVVRVNPYRVDWRSPDGQWVHGAPIPVSTAPLTAAEKKLDMPFLAQYASGVRWPAAVPPIQGEPATFATPDGYVLVGRPASLAHPGQNYDVIDRHGLLVGMIALAKDWSVRAFGAHAVYVVDRKDNDSATLERHPWP